MLLAAALLLAAGLAANETLEALDLRGNGLTALGASSFAERDLRRALLL